VVWAKPGIFFHDAWNECISFTWKTKKFSLTLGGGIALFGIIELPMASTLNFLTIDAIFNWPLIENSDQFARQMVYLPRKIR
jgi:hypothetical protein